MASTIQIKRGTGSAVPTGLADGELAINLDSGHLYFGSGSTSVNSFRFKDLTADNYTVSSSVTNINYQTMSGSTQFGDSAEDTHQFTGSILHSGSLTVTENVTIGTSGNRNRLDVYGRIYTHGSSVEIGGGHISMSGNLTITGSISSSGNNTIIELTTGSFDHFITTGDTIEFRNAGTRAKEGTLKFDTTNGLTVGDADKNPTKLKAGSISTIDAFTSNGTAEFYGRTNFTSGAPVTASIISTSGEITTPILKGAGTTTGLIVDGYSNFASITSSGAISASGECIFGTTGLNQNHLFYGRIKTLGSEVSIGEGQITIKK